MKKMKLDIVAFPVLLALSLTGCTSGMTYSMCSTGNVDTAIESYKADHTYSKVLVDSAPQFANLVCSEFATQNIECLGFNQVFSPLKTYSNSDLRDELKKQRFDAVLIASDGSSSVNSWNMGSITNFNATRVGNSVNGFAMSTNVTGFSRTTRAQIVVYDVPSYEKTYLANTVTSGTGSACIGDSVFLRSLSESVVSDLLNRL
ncbi:hypothetical protein [Vibrio vulnificus]|uniref:hypothetical protein n=1 Tax=Vibrio vulnificus TaxID=672 RepID=UPI003ED870BF